MLDTLETESCYEKSHIVICYNIPIASSKDIFFNMKSCRKVYAVLQAYHFQFDNDPITTSRNIVFFFFDIGKHCIKIDQASGVWELISCDHRQTISTVCQTKSTYGICWK